jgi:hypothetical protein
METIKEIIDLLNPWWRTKELSKELAKPYRREAFAKLEEFAKYKQIIILTGLRRVGKTTLLYQLIEELLKRTDPKRIFYFNFDKKAEDITKLLEIYSEMAAVDWKKEEVFIFLDEIVKLEDWANKLKLVYDAFPNLKFFISSSASFNLEQDAINILAGRYFLLNIKPLSFKEYLELKGKESLIENIPLHEKEIKEEVESYLLRNFPEIAFWEDALMVKDYLRSTVIDKVVKYDIPEKFKNIDTSLLLTLLEMFYSEPGMFLDYDGLSKKLRISKKTLVKHIFYLEFSYLIKKVRNFRVNALTSSKKLQRVYAYWWPFDYCYNDKFDNIMENIVTSYKDIPNYWREGGKEIDFIILEKKTIIPLEVKNKEELSRNELKNMVYFLEKYNLKKGMIVYMGIEDEINVNGKIIKFMPLWKWLLFQ